MKCVFSPHTYIRDNDDVRAQPFPKTLHLFFRHRPPSPAPHPHQARVRHYLLFAHTTYVCNACAVCVFITRGEIGRTLDTHTHTPQTQCIKLYRARLQLLLVFPFSIIYGGKITLCIYQQQLRLFREAEDDHCVRTLVYICIPTYTVHVLLIQRFLNSFRSLLARLIREMNFFHLRCVDSRTIQKTDHEKLTGILTNKRKSNYY